MLKLKLTSVFILLIGFKSFSQAFNCYVTNDSMLSPKIYKFDVYIEATSSNFYFRSVQMGLSFNPLFIPANATITAVAVPGTSEIMNFIHGNFYWNVSNNVLNVTTSYGASCINSPSPDSITLVMVGKPIRISTFHLIADTPFYCARPNISMILPNDPFPFNILRMALSIWNDTCLAIPIQSQGTFTHFTGNTLYGSVNNPLNTNCVTGISEVESSYRIFPNPVTEQITIQSKQRIQDSAYIYDSSGKVIREIPATKTFNTNIDVSALPAGLYIIRIGNSSLKIVKQ
jgi:hypothetical protein